jgi:hypothetical protein
VPKTNVPDHVQVAGHTFHTNAVPDAFDALDLVYRPKLQMLPDQLDQRAGQVILDQSGESCTGNAVAGLINSLYSTLPPGPAPVHGAPRATTRTVSPYMLYWLARRYDEYPGTADVGSSLRAALKGWYYHGVCAARLWKHDEPDPEQKMLDASFLADCLKTPLGAYYRVNARRIDDLQSALTELNGIVVSASIHRGWLKPKEEDHGGQTGWVIRKDGEQIGGHAFLIAGYNEIGFLVQNSWGRRWGRHGYATLPYDDWLDNAYDAWVARPGVPETGVHQERRVVVPSGAGFVTGVGPNLARLSSYAINVTAGGKMSPKGAATSSPLQIRTMTQTMGADLESWAGQGYPRRLVVYAHGGLVGEAGGIAIADRMIDWWRANHLYPIHVIWESDAMTTILSYLDGIVAKLPFGGIRDGIYEAIDRGIEAAGRNIQSLWAEMKTNALLASSPRLPGTLDDDAPGFTYFVDQLQAYATAHPDLEVHLVGHSAGSVMLAGAVDCLVAAGIPIRSMQLMGGAISIDEFQREVLGNLAGAANPGGMLKWFTAYDLDDKHELDDVCPGPPLPAVYHKSLLYFVARSLEPAPNAFEEAMVGLYRSATGPMPSNGAQTLVDLIGGPANLVEAPTADSAPLDSRSKALGHGDFDDDEQTMTSVLLRILAKTDLVGVHPYPKGGMPSQPAR